MKHCPCCKYKNLSCQICIEYIWYQVKTGDSCTQLFFKNKGGFYITHVSLSNVDLIHKSITQSSS